MIEQMPLDIKKLNEDDRRFLLDRNMTQAVANSQGSLGNISILMSLVAILIATYSVVYQTGILWVILPYAIFSVIGLIFAVVRYKRAQRNLVKEMFNLKINYDELFKHHFGYAIRRNKK
jgi:hypothetical protein